MRLRHLTVLMFASALVALAACEAPIDALEGPGEDAVLSAPDAQPDAVSPDTLATDGIEEDVADAQVQVPCETDDDCAGLVHDEPCQLSLCDDLTGTCVLGTLKDYTPCKNDDACTFEDFCMSGECSAGPALPCDDGNPCTTDLCDATDGCVYSANDDNACDDGNGCTTTDHCSGGQCVADDEAACECKEDADCESFEDGDLCNGTLACNDGACGVSESTVVLCDTSKDTQCSMTKCIPNTGACEAVLVDDVPCSDGDPCTAGDVCGGGVCSGVKVACECDTNDDCKAFEDGNLCNGTLTCDAGSCVVEAGTEVMCDPGQDTSCATNTCNPQSGACELKHVSNGTECDDADSCTKGDQCTNGVCGGEAVVCDDGSACTSDVCDSEKGCTFTAIDCTLTDEPCTTTWCDDADGCMSAPQACDDENACTKDHCDEETGDCKNEPIECEDGDACTLEGCNEASGCEVLGDLGCSGDDACTVYGCDAEKGCVEEAKDCSDGDACTADACDDAGECKHSAVICDDGDGCTDDLCNATVGCLHPAKAEGAGCDDADGCTIKDSCTSVAEDEFLCLGEPVPGCPANCGDGFCYGDETAESCPADCDPGPTKKGSCCLDNSLPDLDLAPGCTDVECEASVCGADSYCCEVSWDSDCASCANGGFGAEGLDCADIAKSCESCTGCGDGVCAVGESPDTCPEDCKDDGAVCDNGICEEGESPENCPADCKDDGAVCDNGICEDGENPENCPADCKDDGAVCDNGICEDGENPENCPADCKDDGAVCNNGICEDGENPENCPADCKDDGAVCNNGICEDGENPENCPADCKDEPGDKGSCCEDNSNVSSPGCADPECEAAVCAADDYCCEFAWDQWCASCANGGIGSGGVDCSEVGLSCKDCGAGFCGDGLCDGGETPAICPEDCQDDPFCGDGDCNGDETLDSCPEDCQDDPYCGDGDCNGDETLESCPEDCEAGDPVCDNGICEEGEDAMSCPEDCSDAPADKGPCCVDNSLEGLGFGPGCKDGECEAAVCDLDSFCCEVAWDSSCAVCANSGVTQWGLDCASVGASCAQCNDCGDGLCADNESPATCPADCKDDGAVCDNGICEEGESPETCPQDCDDGPADKGPCCVDNSLEGLGFGPGCSDEVCEGAVCDLDSFCCDGAWDSACAVCAAGGVTNWGLDCASVTDSCPQCSDDCGDGVCADDETPATCPEDCKDDVFCGDGECNGDETVDSCPEDCKDDGAVCDNGICEEGESPETCPQDCKANPFCGDGECNGEETLNTCPEDCKDDGPVCDNGICEDGEDAQSCPEDCDDGPAEKGPCCVDNSLEDLGFGPGCKDEDCEAAVCDLDSFCCDNAWDWNCATCANGGVTVWGLDCASVIDSCLECSECGDGLCAANESHATCPNDCPPICGDGLCSGDEDCGSCKADCGSCYASPAPGDVIITEIMVNPAVVSDASGEYIEVYNMTGLDLDLTGVILADNTSSEEVAALIIPAEGYLVFGASNDVGGYGPDWVWNNIALSNTGDTVGLELKLDDGTTELIDIVTYDEGWPFGDGASMMLSDANYGDQANDDGGNWCQSFETFGMGDLGSPGDYNGECANCGNGICTEEESCDSCPEDCGSCDDGGGGGNGGDGSGCCEASGLGICESGSTCRDAVCDIDSYCCMFWDSDCASCANGGPGWGGICSDNPITPDQCSCQDPG